MLSAIADHSNTWVCNICNKEVKHSLHELECEWNNRLNNLADDKFEGFDDKQRVWE